MKRKYEFNDVINEFAKTEYELLSDENDYINCGENTLKYICPKHQDKGIQTISLSHLMQGRGCYYCGRERTDSKRLIKLNYDEHKQLCESKGFIYLDTLRINGKITIKFICSKHQDLGEQYMTVHNMKREIKGCQYCTGRNLPKWYILKKIDEINPNVELLEDFEKLSDRVKCNCKKHNITSYKTIQSILKGKGCIECGKDKLSEQKFLTIDEAQEKVSLKNPHIHLLEYKGAISSSICLCTKHNKKFTKTPYILYTANSGCDECYTERLRETQGLGRDGFISQLNEIHPELIVLGEYINNSTPIELYCTKHDYKFTTLPNSVLNRIKCCDKTFITYKEEKVNLLLEKWGYRITRQKYFDDCYDKKLLYFDTYLDDYNILIEYQGEQHYYPVRYSSETMDEANKRLDYTQKHDKIKKKYCIKNHIPLIYIPYWEFENLEYYLFNKLVKYNVIQEIQIA